MPSFAYLDPFFALKRVQGNVVRPCPSLRPLFSPFFCLQNVILSVCPQRRAFCSPNKKKSPT